MKILAIETSCDETAAAVVEDGRKILSNVVSSQIDIHKIYGGVVPEIASRCHIESISGVVAEALKKAGATLDDIEVVAVTYAPGLIGALLVGVNYAKGLALAGNIPLIPVHHLRGHIAANYLENPGLEPPFLSLVVSGGHSHIILTKSYTNFEVIARTHDDAAGETFDKAARVLGLPYPGGPHLDKLAESGNPLACPLPTPRVEGHPLDFSFSGLKTAVINTVHNAEQKGKDYSKADLAAALRSTVVRMLEKSLFEAAEQFGVKTILLAGGVSANKLLRETVNKTCRRLGYALFVPSLPLCGDNAAMIGAQAYYEFLAGNIAGQNLNAVASIPISEIGFNILEPEEANSKSLGSFLRK